MIPTQILLASDVSFGGLNGAEPGGAALKDALRNEFLNGDLLLTEGS